MLVLNEAEVRELLPAADLVGVMETTLAAFSNGEVTQPVRTALAVGPECAFFGVMPAYIPSPPAVGAKLVTVFSGNTSRGLPTHFAAIVLVDPLTGAPVALIAGAYITAARTAAVSSVAVRHLSRGDAAVLAILGSGVQARSHLEALCQARRFREVRAWSPTPEHLARFIADGASTGEIPLRSASYAEDAVHGADVIVLATSSSTPAIQNKWVDAGALVISLGAYRPDMREM